MHVLLVNAGHHLRPAKPPLDKQASSLKQYLHGNRFHMQNGHLRACVCGPRQKGRAMESVISITGAAGSSMAQARVRGAALAPREGTFDTPTWTHSEPSLIMSCCQRNLPVAVEFEPFNLVKVCFFTKRCFVYLFMASERQFQRAFLPVLSDSNQSPNGSQDRKQGLLGYSILRLCARRRPGKCFFSIP